MNRVDSPRDENGNYNYEVLECLDVELFNQNMTDLLAGKTVEMPEYNFIKGEREYHGDYLTLGADDVLVIEGIHCLNEKLSYALPRKNKFKIYISALTQLNIDEHNRIPTTDGLPAAPDRAGCKNQRRFCPGYHSHVAIGAPWGGREHLSIPGGCRCHVQLSSGI